jgi:hypothetical protein
MNSVIRRRLECFWDADDQLARSRGSDAPGKRLELAPELPTSTGIPLYLRKLVKLIFSVLLTAICIVFNVCCALAASGQ